jgi:ABC-type amino acid transport system permease subunit
MKKILLILFFLISLNLSAQDKIEITSTDYDNQKIEMADQFRAEGKIYIVVAVIMVILAGMIFYLYRIEAKVKKLEKDIESSGKAKTL